jgi:hypothetical protein
MPLNSHVSHHESRRMRLRAGVTGEGIRMSIGESEPRRLEPSPEADQVTPRRNYVYAHYDEKGTPFYVGKGVGRRAWHDSRHPLWHRYVERHLGGKYSVRILADDLSPQDAEAVESEWIVQESDTLVNWINFGRKTDLGAVDKYHALRNANRELIAETRPIEKLDPERAVSAYYQAIANIAAYATLKTEGGLIGRLLDEVQQELGYSGELQALDRLTLCLRNLGRGTEALAAAEKYFAEYRADAALGLAESIRKRVAKVAR